MLGEELRRRREEKGLSLAEISESTRIGTRFLKAIESENYKALPGGIFTRSFIRAYAKQVGMNQDEAVALYQDESGAVEQPQSDPAEVEGDTQTFSFEEPSYGLLKAAAAAGVIALVLGLGGWQAYVYFGDGTAADSAPAAVAETRGPSGVGAPAESAVAPAHAETRPVSLDEGIELTLEATDNCWIGFTADSGSREQMLLKAGETKTIEATEKIDLTVGNTRVVNIRINGRDAGFPEPTPVTLERFEINTTTAMAMLQQ